MAAVNVEPDGLFAQELVKRMNELGVTIRDLAEKTEITYESIRKLAHGVAFPSNFVLKEICKILSMDYEHAKKLVVEDRIIKKYGSVASVLAGKNPELDEIERFWAHLTDSQKKDIVAMVQVMANRNLQGK